MTPWDGGAQLPGLAASGPRARHSCANCPGGAWNRTSSGPRSVGRRKHPRGVLAAGIPGGAPLIYNPFQWDPPKLKGFEKGIAYALTYFDPATGERIAAGDAQARCGRQLDTVAGRGRPWTGCWCCGAVCRSWRAYFSPAVSGVSSSESSSSSPVEVAGACDGALLPLLLLAIAQAHVFAHGLAVEGPVRPPFTWRERRASRKLFTASSTLLPPLTAAPRLFGRVPRACHRLPTCCDRSGTPGRALAVSCRAASTLCPVGLNDTSFFIERISSCHCKRFLQPRAAIGKETP